MEKKSRNLTGILILAIIAIVVGATAKKVYDEHNEKLLRVVSQKIAEAAEACYRNGVCGNEVTLSFLVEKEYIDLPVHPISKEYVDANLIVTCENFDCKAEVKK